MPDFPQNGHSDAAPLPPLVRPPLGERAGRGLSALDPAPPEVFAPPAEISASQAEVPPSPAEVPLEEEQDWATLGGNGGGDVPPDPPLNFGRTIEPSGDPNTPRDQEIGLLAHLIELRTRILYCFLAVILAMFLTWNQCLRISEWFAAPIEAALKGKGKLVSMNPTGFFTIYLQVSFISALIITMPFLIFQVWRFIEPALTNNERKYTLVLVPFSSALFFLGAGMGFLMTPMFFKFFLAFQPNGVAANWDYYESVMLMGKTLLVFGVAFQVPVFVIFLNKTGIVSRNLLIQYWRHAVVVIFTLVAFVVPTWDPLTMTACAIPPCLLYLLSIWLIKWL